MLESKLVEIHDDGKTIRVLAVRIKPSTQIEVSFLVRYLGFNPDGTDILLIDLEGRRCTADPHHWIHLGNYPRTMTVAHLWLVYNFDDIPLNSDQLPVVDVAKILGAKLDPTYRDVSDTPRPVDD